MSIDVLLAENRFFHPEMFPGKKECEVERISPRKWRFGCEETFFLFRENCFSFKFKTILPKKKKRLLDIHAKIFEFKN